MPRRSLIRPQDGSPTGEEVDTSRDRRLRRSLMRSSVGPNDRRSILLDSAQRAVASPGSEPPVNPQVFFNCLKLAAENKINAKNAFSLAMIDYLTFAVKSNNSPLTNFQLAGCSIDAGTKIYAARVDHVAGGMAEFAMSMSMMHKKGSQRQENGDEEMDMDGGGDENGQPTQKKKRKAKARSSMLVRDVKELMMDMSKNIPKNKMFSIVGNLMDEAIDSASFSFCDRSRVGCMKNMTIKELEAENGELPAVAWSMPDVSEECDLCPSLSNFKFGAPDSSLDWSTLRSVHSRRNTRVPQATDSPRLTLSQQNLDPGLDEAAAQPFDDDVGDFQNQSFGGDTIEGTIIEEVAACGAVRRQEALADNDEFEFTCRLPESFSSGAYSFQINESDIKPLHGPFYWKYKRPTLRSLQNTERQTSSKKTIVDDGPVEFSEPGPDLSNLIKKRSKTFLSRDTLLRWNPDRHVLPTEDCEDSMLISDTELFPSILDVGLVIGLKIPAPGPNRGKKTVAEGDGGQKVPYDFDNEPDKQYCPYPDQPMMPSDDEDDVDTQLGQDGLDDTGVEDAEAMQNLFQLLNDSTAAASQLDDVFSESRLLPEPANVVATMAPVWKTMRGINMRLLEALLWKQIDTPEKNEEEKLSGRWQLRNLRETLPKKTQSSASVTTTLYALLNLANKKGLELRANQTLSNVTVRRLRTNEDKPRQSRVHPALLAN